MSAQPSQAALNRFFARVESLHAELEQRRAAPERTANIRALAPKEKTPIARNNRGGRKHLMSA